MARDYKATVEKHGARIEIDDRLTDDEIELRIAEVTISRGDEEVSFNLNQLDEVSERLEDLPEFEYEN